MLKKFLVIIIAASPFLAVGQSQNFSHQTDIYLSYASRSGMDGISLQFQYAFGLNRYCDILAALSVINVQNFDAKITQQGTLMTTDDRISLGLRGALPFGDAFAVKMSCLAGLGIESRAYNNVNFGEMITKWEGSLEGKIEFDCQLNQTISLGIFYDYNLFFNQNANDIQLLGVCAGFKLQ